MRWKVPRYIRSPLLKISLKNLVSGRSHTISETGFFPRFLHCGKVCRKNPVSRRSRTIYISSLNSTQTKNPEAIVQLCYKSG
ncbi:hypothetical protein IQ270_23855 [Microcoleus sp. LEGE 07076]|uniref:hypothetical protein n=1 Tax=Microcoleus sp. LEGE 07076 TaxID=915322 RepID=UPI00187F93C0|nr:hypothetical protein [Microcoleus sp. LEGE 07076]MBE9187598.1 hypothetical protein [Microcoleus sp. LEGE 07076]